MCHYGKVTTKQQRTRRTKTIQEKPTSLLAESLVRDGRIQSHIIIVLPTWEIIISAGILMGIQMVYPRFGVTQLIQNIGPNIAQFHFAPKAKKKRGGLVASKSQPQVVTMLEKQTPPLRGSLVRDGRIQIHIIIALPTLEITTFVVIPIIGMLRFGVSPLIQNKRPNIAQFRFAPRAKKK